MRSLLSLLESAVRRSASELVLESDQPVTFMTARGAEVEQRVLPRNELFEMIAAVVDGSQQVELVVGNPIEFTVEADGTWTVHAEPGVEGMLVRARCEGLPDLEIQLDEDVDDPQAQSFEVGFEPSFEPPGASGGGARPRSPRDAPLSQLHVEALDTPSLHEQEPDLGAARPREAAPAAPFESGTWALADEEEFDIGFNGSAAEASTTVGRLPTGFPAEPDSSSAHIGVPDDDDDDDADERGPFAAPPLEPAPSLPRTLSSAVTALRGSNPEALGNSDPVFAPPVSPVPPTFAPPVPSTFAPPVPTPISLRPTLAFVAQPTTQRELTPAVSPETPTQRELGSISSPAAGVPSEASGSTLAAAAAAVEEGALVYLRSPDLAQVLAQFLAQPSVVIDDQSSPEQLWSPAWALPAGAVIIIRREDPSVLLGGILRRLEEGYRVLLETRARTPEGARRILLGVGASDRAQRWLDSQVTLMIEPGGHGPRVRLPS